MLKLVLIGLALTVPQIASAADMPYRHQHVRREVVRRVVADNEVIRCSTTDWLLFTYSSCGQSFDPFSAAAGR